MVDKDGKEDYKTMLIPIDRGYPESAFENVIDDFRVFLGHCFPKRNIAYLGSASHNEMLGILYRGNLETGELE